MQASADAEIGGAAGQAMAEGHVWYHTIELRPGETTSGQVDLRGVAPRVLPGDLAGLRALDVGTYDGFWAFEMERRGAETVAIDIERLEAANFAPINRSRIQARIAEWGLENDRGFRLASTALGSSVERIPCNVYDLTPERIGGQVDVAFCGAILLHLPEPVRALERLRETIRPGGRLLGLEPVSIRHTVLSPRRPTASFRPTETLFTWWQPNLAGLKAWLRTAGFVDVRAGRPLRGRSRSKQMRPWVAPFEARTPGGSGPADV